MVERLAVHLKARLYTIINCILIHVRKERRNDKKTGRKKVRIGKVPYTLEDALNKVWLVKHSGSAGILSLPLVLVGKRVKISLVVGGAD